MFYIVLADATIWVKVFERITAFCDVHEFNCHLSFILLMPAEHYFSESTLSQLLQYLVIIEYCRKIEILPYFQYILNHCYLWLPNILYLHWIITLSLHWTVICHFYCRVWQSYCFLCNQTFCILLSVPLITSYFLITPFQTLLSSWLNFHWVLLWSIGGHTWSLTLSSSPNCSI